MEAGVYKSEAFMPAGVNKYDPIIYLLASLRGALATKQSCSIYKLITADLLRLRKPRPIANTTAR